MAFRFPFSNLHELNLDWILSIVKHFADLIPDMEEANNNLNEQNEDLNNNKEYIFGHFKNEKPEKSTKTSQISQFQKEQEILCDNLYKLNQITKYSQIKLGTNFNKMKKMTTFAIIKRTF